MPQFKDLTGQRFGRLTVIKYLGSSKWLCICDCGNHAKPNSYMLNSGKTKSCGCYQRYRAKVDNTIHGLYHTRLHKIYFGIKQRCYNSNNPEFKHYGGKGVVMCGEWLDSFESFYSWAMANGYSDNLSIDRINNDGNYEPSNCRWATNEQQAFNRSDNRYIECNGKVQTLTEWELETGIERRLISARLDRLHWSAEDALFKPVRKMNFN